MSTSPPLGPLSCVELAMAGLFLQKAVTFGFFGSKNFPFVRTPGLSAADDPPASPGLGEWADFSRLRLFTVGSPLFVSYNGAVRKNPCGAGRREWKSSSVSLRTETPLWSYPYDDDDDGPDPNRGKKQKRKKPVAGLEQQSFSKAANF
ncbi:hypothetical protein B0H13DRAFT_1896558 [Mycena leptocephala]|nr:hypothetical protein B0H13DRAFT_1896558 [Mycena leptocephala]